MIGGLAGLMVWAAAAGATPADGAPPLDAFFAKPAVNGLRLSPSGRYLASIQKRGEGQAVVVFDRQTGAQRVVTYAASSHIGFDWIDWKDNNRLLVRAWLYEVLHANNRPDGPVTGFRFGRYLEAVDRDSGRLTVMFRNSPIEEQRSAPFIGFLDLLPDDPGHVLVTAPDAQGYSSVWKVDVETGEGALVETGDLATVDWGVDGQGGVVERTELRDGLLSFQTKDPTGGWTQALEAAQKPAGVLNDIEILGPAPGAGQVYVATAPPADGDRDARTVRIFDTTTRTLSAPQWPALPYDVSSIVYRAGAHDLAGVCYVADVFTCDFKDPANQAAYGGLSRYFHGERNVAPVSLSRDGRLWGLSVTGADAPGAYYLFDAGTKAVSLVGERYPELAIAKLGPTRPYAFKARDGAAIAAYLTAPPGAAGGPLPTVVLVHGGPGLRDSLDFDPLAQFLATRGYQVFRPNVRGSGGYGHAWARAGRGRWGGLDGDDITDGVRSLIDAGRADPARICIIGGDYGGYAALRAGAAEPDLYRCVAGWAAPSDLSALAASRRKATRAATDQPAAVDAPVRQASRFKAPVLLIHGDQDDVVPLAQSKAMVSALTRAGKQARLMVLDGEGHDNFGDAHAKAMFLALADFLDQHIGKAAPP